MATSSANPVVGKVLHTRLGWVAAAAREGKLVAVSLPTKTEAAAVANLGLECDLHARADLLERLSADLHRYFSGERVDLSLHPVDLSGHPTFRVAALLVARRIPYGEVRSYQWVAAEAGNPLAARAAGQAMRCNPLPLVIPCHRVVGSGGLLTGFGGGLAMKRALLILESAPLQ
jgi:methylated-DNA-[protein]-cysteine S-methyltransferase